MAFTDPISLNPGTGAVSLPRVSTQGNASEYRSADGLLKFTSSHAYGRRVRRVLRVDWTKISADVIIPSQNARKSMSHYMVFDEPTEGFSLAERTSLYTGFLAVYNASTNAMITKLLGGES